MTNYVRPQLAMFREEPDLPDAPEVVELKECEAIIEQNLEGYVAVGVALHRIKEKRLYKFSFNSFEEYVKERWSKSRAQAYRMIAAAQLVAGLESQERSRSGKVSPIGDKITPLEAQARVLVAINDTALRKVIWDRAVEQSGGNRPSAAFLKKLVDAELGRSPQGRPSAPAPPPVPAPPIEGEVLPAETKPWTLDGGIIRDGMPPPAYAPRPKEKAAAAPAMHGAMAFTAAAPPVSASQLLSRNINTWYAYRDAVLGLIESEKKFLAGRQGEGSPLPHRIVALAEEWITVLESVHEEIKGEEKA